MHLLYLLVVSTASCQRNVPIIDKMENIKDKKRKKRRAVRQIDFSFLIL